MAQWCVLQAWGLFSLLLLKDVGTCLFAATQTRRQEGKNTLKPAKEMTRFHFWFIAVTFFVCFLGQDFELLLLK